MNDFKIGSETGSTIKHNSCALELKIKYVVKILVVKFFVCKASYIVGKVQVLRGEEGTFPVVGDVQKLVSFIKNGQYVYIEHELIHTTCFTKHLRV